MCGVYVREQGDGCNRLSDWNFKQVQGVMVIKAGELRHRIRHQQPSRVSDTEGGFTTTWSTNKTVWAAIWPQKGKEYVDHMLVQGDVITKIRIRYFSGVDIGDRFQDVRTSAIYKINFVMNWENRNIYLDCLCTQEV